MVDNRLIKVDNDLAPDLNEKYGLNIRYFYPLYSCHGRHHIITIFYFMEAFKIIIEKYSIKKIFIYNFLINDLIDGMTDTRSILSFLYSDLKIEIVELNNKLIKQFSKTLNSLLFFHRKLYSVLKNANYNPNMLRDKIEEYFFSAAVIRFYDPLKKTILLHEPLYDLGFLRKNLVDSYNIHCFPRSADINQVKLKDDVRDESVTFETDKLLKEPVNSFFAKDIQADINKHINQYISEIQKLKTEEINKVSLGVWGNPPVSHASALLFEYLLSEGIPVVGAQHGCTYGDTIYPWHFCADFNRCDYFFSWGFSNKDMKRLYPDKQSKCSVVPVGRSKQLSVNNNKRIDILFPLMNTVSVLAGGMKRLPPNKLARRQIKLLEYLNTLKSIKVIVKPFRWSDFESCAALVVLKRLKRLKIDHNMDLNSYLQKKMPKAILIEFPSTSLYECIHLDIEIFLMNDPINPYEEYALKEIGRASCRERV